MAECLIPTKQWISGHDKDDLLLPTWQRLVNLMAELCDTPAGFIVQAGNDKYKVIIANQSVENPYQAEATIDADVNIFCKKVVEHDCLLYVGNATECAIWQDNPEVSQDGFNTYLGYPLHWPDGSVFGTICVMDFRKTQYGDKYHTLVEHFRDMAERELELLNKNILLESVAFHDHLTTLVNRKGFFFAAEQLLKSAKRTQAAICICYFDIDNLKPINDNYGHQAGDLVLKTFAESLKHSFREVDIVSRFGGDEFVVMCQESNQTFMPNMIERLRQRIATQSFQPTISFSCGYTSIAIDDVNYMGLDYLIKLADDEMYKEKGKKKQ